MRNLPVDGCLRVVSNRSSDVIIRTMGQELIISGLMYAISWQAGRSVGEGFVDRDERFCKVWAAAEAATLTAYALY